MRGWQRLSLWIIRSFFVALIFAPLLSIPLSWIQNPTFAASWRTQGIAALAPIAFVLLPLGLLAALWFGAPLLQKFSFHESPLYNKTITISFERGGIRAEELILWSQVTGIEETTTHIFILFGDNHVFIIPKRAFESDFAATQFAARCRDERQNAVSA